MRNGFSLIEILVVIAIATIVIVVVGNVGSNMNVLKGLVSQELQSQSSVSQELQIMTMDIQSAEPSAAGAFPINSAGTSSFAFYANADNDPNPELVHYFLASSSIWRGVTQPTGSPATYPTSTEVDTAVISNVFISTGTPLFSYYTSAYTGAQAAMTSTVDVSPIQLVGITFIVNTAQRTQAPTPQYYHSLVDIRILHSND